ncbi:MAG TPA: XRE family transcriptional regulator [Ruminococcaceae bacterium]|nr:XRE family transcriptional regulator [Oscillospiraceae bacterium]
MRLKELREARGMTQLYLADKLNMSQNTVSRYESHKREAGYKELIAIADFFHVSIDYLLERTDDPTFPPKKHPPSL